MIIHQKSISVSNLLALCICLTSLTTNCKSPIPSPEIEYATFTLNTQPQKAPPSIRITSILKIYRRGNFEYYNEINKEIEILRGNSLPKETIKLIQEIVDANEKKANNTQKKTSIQPGEYYFISSIEKGELIEIMNPISSLISTCQYLTPRKQELKEKFSSRSSSFITSDLHNKIISILGIKNRQY